MPAARRKPAQAKATLADLLKPRLLPVDPARAKARIAELEDAAKGIAGAKGLAGLWRR
jgi:hypothetical protein